MDGNRYYADGHLCRNMGVPLGCHQNACLWALVDVVSAFAKCRSNIKILSDEFIENQIFGELKMETYTYVNIFETKGLEYILLILFLILLVFFVRYLSSSKTKAKKAKS